MSGTRGSSRRPAAAGLLALLLALPLTGCAGGGTGRSTAQDPAASAATARPAGASAAPAPAANRTTRSPEPTLPPGDPGADAPGVDDPNTAPTEAERPAAARRHVPVEALLDAATIGSVTGTSWTVTAAPADGCNSPRVPGAVAARDRALTGPGGQVVESVATYADPQAARAAVRALSRRLADCAGSQRSDPRVGDASVQATVASSDGTSTLVTAVAADGVLAVLSGRGAVSDGATWPSLTDLALGNLCVATRDGCH